MIVAYYPNVCLLSCKIKYKLFYGFVHKWVNYYSFISFLHEEISVLNFKCIATSRLIHKPWPDSTINMYFYSLYIPSFIFILLLLIEYFDLWKLISISQQSGRSVYSIEPSICKCEEYFLGLLQWKRWMRLFSKLIAKQGTTEKFEAVIQIKILKIIISTIFLK